MDSLFFSLSIKSIFAMLTLLRGSAHEIAFAAQMHENRGRVPRFSYFQREKVSAWELSDVRVLQSQNTDCRKNCSFSTVSKRAKPHGFALFCANTAAPLSASAVKQIDCNEWRFLSFSFLFCRGSVLINQRLRHFHRCLALIQAQRQIRCRTGIEQQAALEFTVAAERGQAREIGLGEGE